MSRSFIILILSLAVTPVVAQPPQGDDPSWTEPPPTTLQVRLGVISPSLIFNVEPIAHLQQPGIEYHPSAKSKTAVGFAYGSFGLSGGFNNPVDEEDQRLYGESRNNDWQLRFYGRLATWDLIYQDYEGYYIENTEAFDPSANEATPRIRKSDLRNVHYGLHLTYVLDPDRFHLGSSFDQSARQLRTGHSFFLTGGIDHNLLTASESVIPAGFRETYGALGTLTKGSFSTVSAGGGWGLNYVGENDFYVGALIGLSLGGQYQVTDSDPPPSTPWQPTLGGKMKLAIGHNKELFFWGLTFHYDMNRMGVMDGVLVFTAAEAALSAGYRFGPLGNATADTQ